MESPSAQKDTPNIMPKNQKYASAFLDMSQRYKAAKPEENRISPALTKRHVPHGISLLPRLSRSNNVRENSKTTSTMQKTIVTWNE